MSDEKNNNNATAVEDKQLNSRLQSTPIAIVGMASVFAESKNLAQFWDNIVESVNGIKDIPEDRWAIDDYYSSDKKVADKSYCKRGGFLPEVDFDPMEFGLPPNILELTDITQLMSLVVARDVLADAGISDENSYDRDKIGITLGVGGGQKQGGQLVSRLQGPVLDKVLKASGVNQQDRTVIIDKFKKAYIPWEENSFPGMLGNVIAGRIANRFNFGGTNCVVDAACAGSLAAIKMAVSDLLEYRSEMMISGGVCCDNSPFMYMSFSKTPAFTDADNTCPFDEKSKGMMIGEGVGMIALKRLEDAERDGDKIYAVIKGIGSSSDGRFKSIYAPRPEGQLKALKRAYADAGFDPKTCGLIEAHGTGTKAGDAAEFTGLNLLFSEHNDQKQYIALGSVKSQIGHTKAAAGTAGIIKAALALHHKILPATINVDQPNQNLDIENTPLYVNNETRPWMPRADGIKRRAGISSFGFGGTNFHFVLEEYKNTQTAAYRLISVPQTILISAADKAALIASLSLCLENLAIPEEQAVYAFNALVCEHPLRKLADDDTRCGFVAQDAAQAKIAIEQILKQLNSDPSNTWSTPSGLYYRDSGLATAGKVVALFSGQGSQYLNMGRDLLCNFPPMLASAAQMDKQFSVAGLPQLSETLYPIPVFSDAQRKAQQERLRLTQYAQPSIGAFSVGLYNTFSQAGFKSDFTAGHSFGELTALWAAGVVSDSDYMTLARSRGQAMAAPSDPSFDTGTMIAVIGAPDEIADEIKAIPDITIANYNAKNQVVVAGVTDQISVASAALQAKGYKVVDLPVSAAFHTELVGHAQKPFAEVIDSIEFKTPSIPVYANGSGKAHAESGEAIKASLKNHILEPVHFSEQIENLYQAGGRIFVEFGPKNVLTRLVDNILADKNDVTTIAINSNAHKSADLQLRLAAVEMAVLGLSLHNIDPYDALERPLVAPKKSPLAMKLTGAAYVSDKSKKAFSDCLNDGWTLSGSDPKVVEKVVIKEVIVEKVVEKIVYLNSDGTPLNQAVKSNDQSELAQSIEQTVASFVNQQAQLLNVHQEYMQGPKAYAETFQTVLQAQAGATQLPESLDKTLAMYHQFQSDTLRVHETYLNNQTANMAHMLSALPDTDTQAVIASLNTATTSPVTAVHKKPHLDLSAQIAATHQTIQKNSVKKTVTPIPATGPVVNAPIFDLNSIEKVMLAVVADKTGYPAEMLELSMDMEADLGIDSIKRVEILGAVQDEISHLPELNAEDLAELRTLGEIVTYMGSVATSIAAPANVSEPLTAQPAVTLDLAQIEKVMLSVVADKTGYPAEMLELSMDMEADLGIDSIKRVEILGAVQDEISHLPELNAEDLAELRTLGEIVTYMGSVAASIAAPVNTSADTPLAAQPTVTLDLAQIEKVMLAVVADKTGYPAEMLELSMDMEADLGIDSIKRVEILGAVQDEISHLPELNAEDLAELRTLGEIVTYMGSVAASIAVPASADTPLTAQATVTLDLAQIEKVMLAVVADKTGYPTEMLELSMDMEADLGIDSIKRVEILGAVQDEISHLPELNAEDLAELRTLGEIVTYMGSVAASIAVPANAPLAAQPTAMLDLSQIEKVMLSVVADKTGYPTEMLELSMDMEADLGIDSIKRVEILGAVQDEISHLPELNAEDLAELRTLGEIVTYMGSVAASIAVPENTSADTTLAAQPSVTLDLAQIEKVMLSVVADKTGYPAEMLELSMDMEADLGIDSIKRVEILGAVQDEISALPELNAQALAELRTLGQIVEYMGTTLGTSGNKSEEKSEVKKPQQRVTKFEPVPSAVVKIQHLEPTKQIERNVNGENLLLVNDGEGASVRLADKLTQLGWTVTVLTPVWVKSVSSKNFADNINQVELAELNEQELTTILATQTRWTTVIYLHPKATISAIEYPQISKQGLQLAFLLAKLTGIAKVENKDARSSFLILTRQGGSFALDDSELDADLVQSGLTALVKTLAHEWPNVFCRAIDIASKFAGDKVANLIIDELYDADIKPVEVGFNHNGRLTLMAEASDSNALSAGNQINQDSLFLVSGGAKGVTAQCVIRLAQQYQSKFILLGRTAYNSDEPNWALGITDLAALKKSAMQSLQSANEKATPVTVAAQIRPILANREIKQTLEAINAAGGLAEYICADVTDSDNVVAAVSPVTDLWGDITGIIHGAGVLADKFIEQKTLADFDAVYNTKIEGLLSLLACCQQDKLQQFVLFSSAAGFYGNAGQSDYAIANDILNKTAYRFKALHPAAQVLSFNWGPWDGGMVTADLKRMFTERGVYIIPLDAGAQLFVNELGADSNRCPQLLVGNDMGGVPVAQPEDSSKKSLVSHLSRTLLAANNPFIADHQIGAEQVLPTVCAIAYMVEAAQAIYPDYLYSGFENYKLFKGIIFNNAQARKLDIDLQLVAQSPELLSIEAKISSTDRSGKTVFHYVATLLFVKQRAVLPLYSGELSQLQLSKQASAASLYKDGTLFHGESFQGILAINACDEQGLLLSCKIESTVLAKQGEFNLSNFNLFANDLVYQALLVWTGKQLGLGALPSTTSRWTVYQEVPVDQPFYLKLTVTEQKGTLLVADIALIDIDKQILANVVGAAVTCSGRLTELFKVVKSND
jgi:acyl transferase domain-containing protein